MGKFDEIFDDVVVNAKAAAAVVSKKASTVYDIINAHIDSVKNQKKCPQCEAKIPRNSIYCNICGAKVEEDEPAPAAQEAPEAAAEVVEEAVETAAETAEEAAE